MSTVTGVVTKLLLRGKNLMTVYRLSNEDVAQGDAFCACVLSLSKLTEGYVKKYTVIGYTHTHTLGG